MPDDVGYHETENKREIKVTPPTYVTRWKNRSRVRGAENKAAREISKESWLNFSSLHYDQYVEQWEYVADHYEGRVLEEERIEKYLIQRSQGESEEAFAERVQITQYTPDFFNAIVTLVGLLFGNEECVTRQWEEKTEDAQGNEKVRMSLGNPNDATTDFGKFWRDVDGEGTNYESFMFNLSCYLVAYGEAWILVDGWGTGEGVYGTYSVPPRIRILPPQRVMRDCYRDDNVLDTVKITSFVDKSSMSQMLPPDPMQIYTIYYPEGYSIWRHDEKGNPVMITPDLVPYSDITQQGAFAYRNKHGANVPPLFRVSLPFDGCLGYLMARKANTLFNHQSTLDMLLHIACFVKYAADVVRMDGDVDHDLMAKIEDAIAAGSSILYGAGSKYVSPPMDPANTKNTILKDYRRDFYTSFFQAYGDRGAQKTATEVRQDMATTVHAFLAVLAVTMEEAENELLYRLEQAWLPSNPEMWNIAKAQWKKDFSTVDDPLKKLNEVIDRVMPGGKVLLDSDTTLRIVLDWLENLGYPVIDDEAKASLLDRITDSIEQQAKEKSMMGGLGL